MCQGYTITYANNIGIARFAPNELVAHKSTYDIAIHIKPFRCMTYLFKNEFFLFCTIGKHINTKIRRGSFKSCGTGDILPEPENTNSDTGFIFPGYRRLYSRIFFSPFDLATKFQ
jgi:hypothetical protein